jgi:6-phosphogluconate dehydrogenase
MILDKAGQKGTGKWTSQAAMDFGVPIPTIDSAVSMRQISAQKEVRALIAKKYGSQKPVEKRQLSVASETVTSEPLFDAKAARAEMEVETIVSAYHRAMAEENAARQVGRTVANPGERNKNTELRAELRRRFEEFVKELEHALLASFIVTYAQGMSLLQIASVEKGYGLNLAEIARIWRGGCIIRSALLEEMRRAFAENPQLPNLILDDRFAEILNDRRRDWRAVAERFTESRVPALCLSASLASFDAFRSARLPANLIQAQRDYFGAHSYLSASRQGRSFSYAQLETGLRASNLRRNGSGICGHRKFIALRIRAKR